jgi:DNA-binding response OmpR family regulator
MRVLVISADTGDAGESGYLTGAVARRGCEVVTARSMHDGLAALDEVDVAMLNVGSTEADLVPAIETIRAQSDLPLVVMAAKASPDKCAEALLAGADDYLARLINIDELMVRLQVLRRRHRGCLAASWRLVAGDVEIDLERRLVLVAGDHIDLTKTEFRILSTIARQGGRVCTKEKLMSAMCGDTREKADEQLRAHIADLRLKLARPLLIQTVEFVGYRLATRPTVRSVQTTPASRGVEGA